MSFFQRMFVPFHVFMFRLSGGRLLGKSGGLPVLLLTTTGRKSGKQRTMPLFYLDDGGALAVSASAAGGPRHPAWYVNLVVNATVQVQTRAGKRAMVAETAGGRRPQAAVRRVQGRLRPVRRLRDEDRPRDPDRALKGTRFVTAQPNQRERWASVD